MRIQITTHNPSHDTVRISPEPFKSVPPWVVRVLTEQIGVDELTVKMTSGKRTTYGRA